MEYLIQFLVTFLALHVAFLTAPRVGRMVYFVLARLGGAALAVIKAADWVDRTVRGLVAKWKQP